MPESLGKYFIQSADQSVRGSWLRAITLNAGTEVPVCQPILRHQVLWLHLSGWKREHSFRLSLREDNKIPVGSKEIILPSESSLSFKLAEPLTVKM